MCWLRAHVRGTGGHGALGVKGGAMRKLGDVLRTLDRKQPPVHIIPLVREWFEAMAAELPRTPALLLRRLLDPRTADLAARALGPRGRQLSRVIRNTVSPTIVHGGDKINVIPSEIELQLDGRILPGQTPDDLIRELHDLVGTRRRVRGRPPRSRGRRIPTSRSTSRSRRSCASSHPGSVPVPMLQAGVTDARFLSRAGVQTYGYLPLQAAGGLRAVPAHPQRRRARAGGRARVRRRGDHAGDRALPRMKLLVLGGTKFLGRHAVDAALAGGHDVTIFTRGQTNPELFPGGRASAAATATATSTRCAAGTWDGVVDTSGYVPRIVRQSAELLRDRRRPLRLRLEHLRLRRLQRAGHGGDAGRRARRSGDRRDHGELRRAQGRAASASSRRSTATAARACAPG